MHKSWQCQRKSIFQVSLPQTYNEFIVYSNITLKDHTQGFILAGVGRDLHWDGEQIPKEDLRPPPPPPSEIGALRLFSMPCHICDEAICVLPCI